MSAEYKESLSEYEDPVVAYLLLVLLIGLFVLVAAPKVFRKISQVINQRRQSVAAWSKKVALIVASNRMESYKAELYCSICYSSATRRCSKCGAVAYCSEKCQRDHWKQGHRDECRLMEDVEEITKANGEKKDELLGLQGEKENTADVCCAYCAADLWFWSEFDIFNIQGYEKDGRTRYLEDECHCKPVVYDAKESGNEASAFEVFSLDPEDLSASDQQELWATALSGEIPPFIALTCKEDFIAPNLYSLSKVCCNKCQVVLICSEHSQRYEGKNGQKQEAQLVDDVEVSTTEESESEFESESEDSISHIAPTLGASATSDQSPRRVTPNGDNAIRNRHPNLKRSSTSSSNDSSCGSWSMDASSVSDAISSLHGLD